MRCLRNGRFLQQLGHLRNRGEKTGTVRLNMAPYQGPGISDSLGIHPQQLSECLSSSDCLISRVLPFGGNATKNDFSSGVVGAASFQSALVTFLRIGISTYFRGPGIGCALQNLPLQLGDAAQLDSAVPVMVTEVGFVILIERRWDANNDRNPFFPRCERSLYRSRLAPESVRARRSRRLIEPIKSTTRSAWKKWMRSLFASQRRSMSITNPTSVHTAQQSLIAPHLQAGQW